MFLDELQATESRINGRRKLHRRVSDLDIVTKDDRGLDEELCYGREKRDREQLCSEAEELRRQARKKNWNDG